MPTKFVIPTIEEISKFMKEKMPQWPKSFCDWYGEKFFHSYESSGWKLSAGRGGPVKNWNSCFMNNWKVLKYKEDIEMLAALTPKPKSIDEDTLNYLNERLEEYRKDKNIERERLAACYQWLKEQRLIKLTFEQRTQAIKESEKDIMLGQAMAVSFVFDYMVNNLITFNYFFSEIV